MALKPELASVLDLLVDGVLDGIKAVENGKNVVADAPLLMQLVQDAIAAGPNFSAAVSELESLSPADDADVVTHVVAKLAIPDAHARLIVDAAIEAAGAVLVLVEAILNKAPAAAPAPTAS